MMLPKKAMYDKLVTKFNAIDSMISSVNGVVTKTQYDSNKQGFERKIEDADKKIQNTSELVSKTV